MRGEHVFVRRLGYTHHGLEVDDDMVVHFTGEPGRKQNAAICLTSMEDFLAGGTRMVRRYGAWDGADIAVERAAGRVGESGYNLFSNNCEHFATWCCLGRMKSSQVAGAAGAGAVVTGSAVSSAAGIGAVSAAGLSGLSGPGIMSGLAAIGGAVGSGAVAGLALLGTAPGVASVLVVRKTLKDDESQPEDERAARAAGRSASVGGAAVGTAAGVGAVSTMGAVAGLSGAGISSGLAALGAMAGGGMAAGVGVVVAAPAVLAAGIGYGGYRLVRRVGRGVAKHEEVTVPDGAAYIDVEPVSGRVVHVEPEVSSDSANDGPTARPT